MKQLIVITGPTAGGKTALSVAVAKHFNTFVFSADSRQFYRELAIGTAKPDKTEQAGIKHYFIDSHSIQNELTAAQYEQEALDLLEVVFKEKDIVVLTGGSGMFIDALCFGLDSIPTAPEIKQKLQQRLEKEGLEVLQSELQKKDPDYYAETDQKNPRRVLRALEAIEITGKPFSQLRRNETRKRPFQTTFFIIDHERSSLYNRIDQRVDQMLKDGLIEEVRTVLPYRNLTALNTVGYKELFAYYDGVVDLETAIEDIKRNTRRYAKRQLTWFRRYPDAHWIKFTDPEQMKKEIIAITDEKTD